LLRSVASGANATDIPPPPTGMRTLGYSPDNRETILLHRDAEVVRWDIEKGKERGRYPKPDHDKSIAALVSERLSLHPTNLLSPALGMRLLGERGVSTPRWKKQPGG
jgi:hypothetical protein